MRFGIFIFASLSSNAATTNLTTIADTTLSQNYPSNNFGGVSFVNSGTTQNLTRNRGLFKFLIEGAIPPHSKIRSADLILEVTKEPADGYAFADFGLHRMLQPWGEGNKTTPTNSPNAGTGSPATTNEATWFYRFAFTTNAWSSPGAGETNDYVENVSSVQTIYGLADSPYTFRSTTQLVADVQFWLDNPQANFGWILVCEDEASGFTARRFASREDPNFAPQLILDYAIPPVIDRMQKAGNEFNLFFTVLPDQTYIVEFRDSLSSNSWQVLANLGSFSDVTRVVVVDALSAGARFYRVRTY